MKLPIMQPKDAIKLSEGVNPFEGHDVAIANITDGYERSVVYVNLNKSGSNHLQIVPTHCACISHDIVNNFREYKYTQPFNVISKEKYNTILRRFK